MEKLEFRKYTGEAIEDIHSYVKDWVAANPHGTVTIGCDSQEHVKHVKYAITIVMHIQDESGIGHGGHVIYASFNDTSKTMKSDTHTKLWAEVEITVEAAKRLGDIGLPIKLHLDYNSDESSYSNVFYTAGIGYAAGFGFEAFGKPYAWAASHTADKIAKSGKK